MEPELSRNIILVFATGMWGCPKDFKLSFQHILWLCYWLICMHTEIALSFFDAVLFRGYHQSEK